jgi:hypothetical protein
MCAAGVRITYVAAVATISTGDRRSPPFPPESAIIHAGRDTAGVRYMLAPR